MKIGLVQINNSFDAFYLPLSVGCLQAYALAKVKNPDRYEFMLPKYKRADIQRYAYDLVDADIVFFSFYTWNAKISLALARELKKRKPDILTVFGGPHVPTYLPSDPDRVKRFLLENSCIDIAVHGEGERPFAALLENIEGDRNTIPSISYFDKNGEFRATPRAPRLSKEDIDALPSPYLTGIFEPLMRANPDEKWLVMWETDRGCPYSCAFCDWGDLIAQKVFKFNIDRVYQELLWVAKHKIEFMFCCNANFGIFPRDVEIAKMAAGVKKQYGYPQALSVQNAKSKKARDNIFEAQYTLHRAGLNKGVTLAFQSRDEEVLKEIRRSNIPSDEFMILQARFIQAGVPTYSDMILGLPGETYDSFANGVSQTMHEGQHGRIQFGSLSILPNAEMGDPAYRKKYEIKTVSVKEVTYHGSIAEPEWEIDEEEDLVVETSTLSREDWVRMRVFCWMAGFLHFDKLLQIPLVLLHETTGISYRHLIEVFCEGDLLGFPILREIRDFFREKARGMQRGEVEFCEDRDLLKIWWPADEFIFIKLARENKLTDFYIEAEECLLEFLSLQGIDANKTAIPLVLLQAIYLNMELLKLPFQEADGRVTCGYNILEFYHSVLEMRKIPLVEISHDYSIDRESETWSSWENWARFVVWYGNKKGAYLYNDVKEISRKKGEAE